MGLVNYGPVIEDMTWSYSRIKSFEDCPYKWFLKYIRYPTSPKRDMFFSDYGKFIHALLADFFSGEKEKDELMVEYLVRFCDEVHGRAPSQKIFQSYFQSGLDYIRGLSRPDWKILGVEDRVEFEVDGIPIVGFIDLEAELSSGELILMDHKSRNLAPRSKKGRQTKSDDELDKYLRQLYIYSIPFKMRNGAYPSHLCLNCFRENLMIKEDFHEDKLEEAKDWVRKSVKTITEEEDFRPDVEFFKCRYLCEMRDYCEYYELAGVGK